MWHATFPDGKVTRLTDDYNDYFTINSAKSEFTNQTELITLVLQRTAQIYRANLNNPASTAFPLTADGDHGYGLSVGAGGQVFYGSTKAGNPDIWTMESDGANQRQLTTDPKLDSQPFAVKNGSYVAFASFRSGVESLWRMKPDGSEQILLTPNVSRDSIAVSPDGKTIYYRNDFKGGDVVWRVSIDGGLPEKVMAGNYKSVAVSPDGQLLAATLQTENDNQLAIVPVNNPRNARRLYKLTEGSLPLEKIRFAPDGQSVVYIAVKSGIGNLWAQPLDGAAPKPMTDFNNLQLYSFDFSPDGKNLYCSRGELGAYVSQLTLQK